VGRLKAGLRTVGRLKAGHQRVLVLSLGQSCGHPLRLPDLITQPISFNHS